jgi:hypothetical protein
LEQVANTLVAQLGAPFDQVWERLVAERGRQQAAQAYKAVLAAVVERGEEEVGRVLRRALEAGEDPILALRPPAPPTPTPPIPAALAAARVQASSLFVYDELLGVCQ